MIHDLVQLKEVTTNTVQTSKFIHFELRALWLVSSSLGFTLTNWNKESCLLYNDYNNYK